MCGIAGILRYDGAEVKEEDLTIILSKMAHRGKDAQGITLLCSDNKAGQSSKIRNNVGLGHCRLSIIDISSEGNQPMRTADGNFLITYNGEIYNYLELRYELQRLGYFFRTSTDTEVLLYAYVHWGRECLKKLNGMFAFAIWDAQKREIFCARDPLGIKPFVYFLDKEKFVFASENRALMHLVDKSLNPDAVAAYLLTMYVPTPWSIFKGLQKLPPAHMLIIDRYGNSKSELYWKVENAQYDDSPEKRYELFSLLKDSARLQIRSDVPVGAFLSGGVDSSTVVALLSEKAKELHTFTVGYKGHSIDERPFARLVAKRYGTTHHEIELSPDSILGSFYEAVRCLDEPIADSAFLPTFIISRMAAAQGVKVLLNGTGGDEIFGGYTRYFQVPMARLLLDGCPLNLRKKLANILLPFNGPLSVRLSYPEVDQVISIGGCVELARGYLGTNMAFFDFTNKLAALWKEHMPEKMPLLYKKMHFDLKSYLLDDLLMLFDSMTMASTVEGRVPLLDTRIVTMAFSFSVESHVQGNQCKRILKTLARDILPEQILNRGKMGFGGPVHLWTRENLKEVAFHANRALRILLGVVPNQNRFLGKILERKTDSAFVSLFRLAIFDIWYQAITAL